MKKGLYLLFIFFLLFVVTGCKTEFDNNNTKLTDMSFNKPFGYKDSRYPIGNLEDGREYEMRVYEFNDYSIEITWREKETFKKYTKGTGLKFKTKTINDKKYKFLEDETSLYYISEHMKGLYVFKFSGNKSKENLETFNELLNTVKYRE